MAKFPKPDDTRDISAGEILALTLAAQAGIQVAEHQRMAVGKQSVAVITRFDRVGKTRVPFISASSLLGLPQGEPGAYTLLADSIRQFGDDVQADLRELWRRLVFSLLASNYDDHLRNHGFLMRAPGRWLLVLGIGVGLWYLTILVMVLRSPRLHGGALPSIILAVIGVLTIGGCINRLMKRIPKQP